MTDEWTTYELALAMVQLDRAIAYWRGQGDDGQVAALDRLRDEWAVQRSWLMRREWAVRPRPVKVAPERDSDANAANAAQSPTAA